MYLPSCMLDKLDDQWNRKWNKIRADRADVSLSSRFIFVMWTVISASLAWGPDCQQIQNVSAQLFLLNELEQT